MLVEVVWIFFSCLSSLSNLLLGDCSITEKYHFKGLLNLNQPTAIVTIVTATLKLNTGPEVIKKIHEILNAHKYENIKKVSFLQAQISLECYNSWHFNIYEQEKFHAQWS